MKLDPIPDLRRNDGEIALFWLEQNMMRYTDPIDDPFFLAHNLNYSGDSGLYNQDKWATVLGCIDQHQFCNPNSVACTPLSSLNSSVSKLGTLGLNKLQKYTSDVIRNSLVGNRISDSVAGRSAGALRAQQTVYQGINGPLPKYQWTIEVGAWFNIALAKLQAGIVEYATGPAFTDHGRYQRVHSNEMTDAYAATCGNQKVRTNGGYLSFSVLGITIVFTIGSVVILVGFWLDTIVGSLRRTQLGLYRKSAWICDGKLHLLRMVNETMGFGNWDGCVDVVPVTGRGELVGVIDMTDEKHPMLAGVRVVETQASTSVNFVAGSGGDGATLRPPIRVATI